MKSNSSLDKLISLRKKRNLALLLSKSRNYVSEAETKNDKIDDIDLSDLLFSARKREIDQVNLAIASLRRRLQAVKTNEKRFTELLQDGRITSIIEVALFLGPTSYSMELSDDLFFILVDFTYYSNTFCDWLVGYFKHIEKFLRMSLLKPNKDIKFILNTLINTKLNSNNESFHTTVAPHLAQLTSLLTSLSDEETIDTIYKTLLIAIDFGNLETAETVNK